MRCLRLATSLRRDALICTLALCNCEGYNQVETGLAPSPERCRDAASRVSTGKTGSPQHQSFHPCRAAGLVIALNLHGAEADVAVGGFEAGRHPAEKLLDH